MKTLSEYSKRVVVAGSRSYNNYEEFCTVVNRYVRWSGLDDLAFISGDAFAGPDAMIKRYCEEKNIPCFLYKANWDKFGKRAGIIRNCEMRDVCSHLLAFWDKVSRGTAHMVDVCYETDYIKVMMCLVKPDPYEQPKPIRKPFRHRFTRSSEKTELVCEV